ncbi:MAG: hypothetical protein HZY73_03955 [Micropruina sp.]|nr:MAG: hypothetical protein HZY73_03955 [Micropruina sp.]
MDAAHRRIGVGDGPIGAPGDLQPARPVGGVDEPGGEPQHVHHAGEFDQAVLRGVRLLGERTPPLLAEVLQQRVGLGVLVAQVADQHRGQFEVVVGVHRRGRGARGVERAGPALDRPVLGDEGGQAVADERVEVETQGVAVQTQQIGEFVDADGGGAALQGRQYLSPRRTESRDGRCGREGHLSDLAFPGPAGLDG